MNNFKDELQNIINSIPENADIDEIINQLTSNVNFKENLIDSNFFKELLNSFIEEKSQKFDTQLNQLRAILKDRTTEFYTMLKELQIEISVRKKAEEKLQVANDKLEEYNKLLEKKVEERTLELKSKNEILIRELEMAKRVQLSIIPDENDFPKRKELGCTGEYKSMESIGGDLYDVIRIGRNSYGFLIADVSGHGVPAALITTMAKVSFNSHTNWGISPADVCNVVNRELFSFIGDTEYYLTAYYAILDLETGLLKFCNAGHQPAILIKSNNEIVELFNANTFIGIFDNQHYECNSINLEEGDKILFFTDGIIEARNEESNFYTYERLINFAKANSKTNIKDFVQKLISDVEEFCGSRPPNDDRAVLLIEFISKINENKSIQKSIKFAVESSKESMNNINDEELLKANTLIKEKKYNQALDILLKLYEEKSNDPNVLNSLGIVYYKFGYLDKAYDVLKEAIKFTTNKKIYKNASMVKQRLEKQKNV